MDLNGFINSIISRQDQVLLDISWLLNTTRKRGKMKRDKPDLKEKKGHKKKIFNIELCDTESSKELSLEDLYVTEEELNDDD